MSVEVAVHARRLWCSETGQGQLLAVMTMSAILMMAGLFALDRARNTSTHVARSVRRTELLQALAVGTHWLQKNYQTESVCDPVRLDLALDQMCDDGSRCLGTDVSSMGRRQLAVPSSGQRLLVSFGRVTPVSRGPALTSSLSGYKGDPALLEDPFSDSAYRPLPAGDATLPPAQPMWSPSRDTRVELWVRGGGLRVNQQVLLLNVCTHPMLVRSDSPYSPSYLPRPSLAYRAIGMAELFGGTCRGIATAFGNLNGDEVIDGIDLEILQVYLRTGKIPANASNPGGVGIRSEDNFALAADVSCDGIVDELDLTVLEKLLRGYLWNLPVFLGG